MPGGLFCAIGNPLSDGTWTYTWEKGRQLARMQSVDTDATTQIFAGLLRCSDCGWSMSYGTNKQNKTPYSYYDCQNYRQYGKSLGKCSAHYVRYDVLYSYVLSRL